MALFIRRNEDRSKLQERLHAELQERQKQSQIENNKPETVDDSAYLKNTKDTSSLKWLWVAVVVIILALLAYFWYRSFA